MGIAQAVRAAIPLGLMKNDHGPVIGSVMKPGTSLLPPPVADWDRDERRVLMFTVLMFDINASSSSGWPNMMMTDELVCHSCRVLLIGSTRSYHVQGRIGSYPYVPLHFREALLMIRER
jgi:hypothetical protein